MSQDYSFSWSGDLSAQANAPSKVDVDELIAFVPCSRHSLPDHQILLTRLHSDVRSIVTAEVLHALSFCTSLRTMREHAETIARVLPQVIEGVSDAEEVLQSLKNVGLFVTSQELLKALAGAKAKPDQQQKTVVCIPTCDRPQLLQRVLTSLVDVPPRTDTACFVIEDSREEANIAKNRQITQQMATLGHNIWYFSLQEQEALVERLQQRLPDDEEEIGFLLGREMSLSASSYGRVFNHALLLSKGSTLVYLDDDVLCQGYPSPRYGDGAEGSSVMMDGTAREADFYTSDEPWKEAASGALDPVIELSALVGCSIPEVLKRLKQDGMGELSLAGMAAQDVVRLVEGKGSVVATLCGLYGDPGTEGHQWMYSLPESSMARLTCDEQTYRSALQERNVWIGQEQACLSKAHSMLSVIKSMDHSRLLPPAFPFFRNEDYLFGKMLGLIYPDGYFLELPWGVSHLPENKRSWPADMLDKPALLGFSRFTGMYLAKSESVLSSAEPASRLRLIGDMLMELGESDPATLRDEVAAGLTYVRTDLVSGLDRRLKGLASDQSYLGDDLQRQIQANQDALFSSAAPGPFDVFESFPETDPLQKAGSLWRIFGKAVHAWERILRVYPL